LHYDTQIFTVGQAFKAQSQDVALLASEQQESFILFYLIKIEKCE